MNRLNTLLLAVLTAMVIASCSHSYYIVRHAEKDMAPASTNMMGNDPVLSEAGKVRAIVLRDELKNKHIRYIFSTNTQRTKSTAEPLSEATGVAIQVYSSTDSLITELKKIRKGNVLVVGHSNTVDDIVNKLCGEVKIQNDLSDSQYDNLFIIKYKGKKIIFTRRKYGYPSNPE
ncbi:MAG: histidine phosphatase family protein [Bacteroidetes bacterium]|nr:histidine phosphatase family protein [Bacteroidota bacterium]